MRLQEVDNHALKAFPQRVTTSKQILIPVGESRRKRLAPCEQRLKQHREFLSLIKRDDPEGYWPTLGRLAQGDYWFFLREVLKYNWLDPWLHGEVICRFLDENPGQAVLVLAPRGVGKSGAITVPRAAWWLAQDPSEGIIIGNAREARAQKMCRSIASIVSNDINYQNAFPWVKPSSKWGEDGYYLDQSVVSIEGRVNTRIDPALSAYGVGGNITGSHVSGALILDDLINEKMAKSPVELQAAHDYFVEAQNCLDPGQPMVIIGTRWHPSDFYGKIIDGELHGDNGPIKCLKLGVEDKEGNIVFPLKTYVDMKGKKKDVGYTPEFLEGRRKNLGRLFSALYYNEPVLASDQQFDVAKIRTFKNQRELGFDIGCVLTLGVEAESQGKALIDVLRNQMREQNRMFHINELTSKKIRKEDRIRGTLQSYIESEDFYVREDLFRSSENIGQEFRMWTGQEADDDDCLDAVAYAVMNAIEPPEGQPPMVSIACDPAFTEERYSDSTAIAAVIKYLGKIYVLDCDRFKTSRTDFTARMIIRMYDRYQSGKEWDCKRFDMKLNGFSSSGSRSSQQREQYSDGFDVDLSQMFTHK